MPWQGMRFIRFPILSDHLRTCLSRQWGFGAMFRLGDSTIGRFAWGKNRLQFLMLLIQAWLYSARNLAGEGKVRLRTLFEDRWFLYYFSSRTLHVELWPCGTAVSEIHGWFWGDVVPNWKCMATNMEPCGAVCRLLQAWYPSGDIFSLGVAWRKGLTKRVCGIRCQRSGWIMRSLSSCDLIKC